MEKLFIRIFSSSLGGQIFALLSYLVVAKNFKPSNFGDYSVAISVASFLIPLATLRVDQRLYSELIKENVKQMVRIGTASTLSFSLILIVLSQVLRILNPQSSVRLQDQVLFIGLITLCVGLSNIFFSFSIFSGQINEVKSWPIKQNLSYLVLVAFFGWISPNVMALVLSMAISRLLPPFLLLLRRVSIKEVLSIRMQLGFTDIKEIFRKSKLAILVALCDQSIVALPIIGLYAIFSSHIAGIASLAIIILQAPSGLISSAISSTILVTLSERNENRSAHALLLVNRYLKRQILIVAILGILTMLSMLFLDSINLGKWNGIQFVIFAQSIPIYLMTLWIPLSSILHSLGLWKLRVRIGIFQLASISFLFIFARFIDFRWQNFILLFSFVSFATIAISCYVAYLGIQESSRKE